MNREAALKKLALAAIAIILIVAGFRGVFGSVLASVLTPGALKE